MTRQMFYVFAGKNRANAHVSKPVAEHEPFIADTSSSAHAQTAAGASIPGMTHTTPHESPPVMTIPLAILAVFAVVLGFIGTPAWPWFQKYLGGATAEFNFAELFRPEVISVLALSTLIVILGIGLGWWFYGREAIESSQPDVLERLRPDIFVLLRHKFYVDEFYEATIIRLNNGASILCDGMDYWVWNGAVFAVSYLALGLSWASRFFDEYVVNLGFDEGCRGARDGGRWLSRLQNGQIQDYLRVIGVALVALGLILLWGCKAL
jgi:NADH-quinone oxidoreductase subunit L